MKRARSSSVAWAMAASLIACGLVYTVLPLHENANHSMSIVRHLQSSNVIQIQFSPKQNLPRTRYNAFIETNGLGASEGLKITSGKLSYEENGARYNYTLWQDRGYFSIESVASGKLQSAGCIDPDAMPPFHSLERSLHEAKVVDAVSEDGDRKGCAHTLLEIQFTGDNYLLCIDPSSAADIIITSIHAEAMDAELTFLSEYPSNLQSIPAAVNACEPLVPADQPLHGLFARMRSSVHRWSADLVPTRRRRLAEFDEKDCTSCSMELKDCLFVHGAGQTWDGPTQSTFPEYWGTIEQHAPCCKSIHFMRMDTQSNPWHSEVLTQQVCDTARNIANDIEEGKPRMIENMLFVTHSVGNLVLANAIATGVCSLGESSKWVASQGPFGGSWSADTLIDHCLNPKFVDTRYQNAIADLFGYLGFCPVQQANYALVFEGGEYSHELLNYKYLLAQEAYRNHADAAICGTSAYGIITSKSPQLKAVSRISRHGSENDGLVELDSCVKSLPHGFSSDYRDSLWYRAAINHEDGKFILDGWWGTSRRPVRWFECLPLTDD